MISLNKEKIFRGYLSMLIFILGVTFIIGIRQTTVYADITATGSVPVIYVQDESLSYPLIVTVKGNGSLNDGEIELRNSKKSYDLPSDGEKTFEIKADKGMEVKVVQLNEKDIKSIIKDEKITIKGAETEQRLVIEFDKKAGLPITRDMAKILPYLVILILSLIGVIFFYKRNEKNIKKLKKG